jgi:hypothetical protein
MNTYSRWIATSFLIANLAAGCATHQRTETVQYDNRRTGDPVAVEGTTTETSANEDSGVLSSTVVVGEVIALPFRAVGGLLRALF